MSNTKLNKKVRNPKQLSQWLDIWSADIARKQNAEGYDVKITPSSNWIFPASYSNSNECLTIKQIQVTVAIEEQ